MLQKDNKLQIARLVIEGMAVVCRNAEHLHIEKLLHGEVVMLGRWRIATKFALEERECKLDRVEVRRVSRQELDFHAAKVNLSASDFIANH